MVHACVALVLRQLAHPGVRRVQVCLGCVLFGDRFHSALHTAFNSHLSGVIEAVRDCSLVSLGCLLSLLCGLWADTAIILWTKHLMGSGSTSRFKLLADRLDCLILIKLRLRQVRVQAVEALFSASIHVVSLADSRGCPCTGCHDLELSLLLDL